MERMAIMPRLSLKRSIPAVATVLVLLAAACGDTADTTTTTAAATTQPAAPATTQAEAAATTQAEAAATTQAAAAATTQAAAAATTQAAAAATTQPPQPAVSGTVTVALANLGTESLDPGLGQSRDKLYWGPMYDFFIGADPDGNLSPDLGALERWDANADATEWTLTIRTGMRWHDGTPVTADDGVFSIERYLAEDAVCSRCPALQNLINRAEKVDQQTFRVILDSPFPSFDGDLSPLSGTIPILPKHYFEAVGAAEFGNNPMGSGPFKFVERQIGESIEFEANLDYWNPDRVPTVERLRIIAVPEAFNRLTLLGTGELDLALMSPVLIDDILESGFRVMGPQKVHTVMAALGQSWREDYDTRLLDMRRAMALAVDQVALVNAVYGDSGVPAASFIGSPVHPGYDPTLEVYPYDPGEATRILQDAGLAGSTVTIYTWTSFSALPEAPLVLEAIAAFLDQVGLETEIVPTDFASIAPQLYMSEGSEAGIEGDNAIHIWFVQSAGSLESAIRFGLVCQADGGNFGAYWDCPTVNRLYGDLLSSSDVAKRHEIALELNRAAHDTFAALPVALVDQVWAVGPRVTGWSPTDFSSEDPRYETISISG